MRGTFRLAEACRRPTHRVMNTSIRNAIEKRYGFSLPNEYLALRYSGHLTWPEPEPKVYLHLSDFEWLTPEEIARYDFFDQIPGLVPFAISARRDEWAWRTDWAVDGRVPVVFCGRTTSAAGYAPDFAGFLYRILLDEFSGTWITNDFGPEGTVAQFHRYVDWVAPLIPARFVAMLRWILASNPKLRTLADGSEGVFPREEADRIAARDLAFPHFDEEFEHYLDLGPGTPDSNTSR